MENKVGLIHLTNQRTVVTMESMEDVRMQINAASEMSGNGFICVTNSFEELQDINIQHIVKIAYIERVQKQYTTDIG